MRLLFVGALVIGAAVTSWLAWDHRKQPPLPSLAARSDYVLHDFQLVALNAQGQEHITLRAPRLDRLSSDESIELTQPEFLLPDSDGRHWTLRAPAGWASAKGEQIRLSGGVVGNSPEGAAMRPTEFSTDTLSAEPGNNRVHTADAVQIRQTGLSMTGVGLELDTVTRELRLLSQVRTRYESSVAR